MPILQVSRVRDSLARLGAETRLTRPQQSRRIREGNPALVGGPLVQPRRLVMGNGGVHRPSRPPRRFPRETAFIYPAIPPCRMQAVSFFVLACQGCRGTGVGNMEIERGEWTLSRCRVFGSLNGNGGGRVWSVGRVLPSHTRAHRRCPELQGAAQDFWVGYVFGSYTYPLQVGSLLRRLHMLNGTP